MLNNHDGSNIARQIELTTQQPFSIANIQSVSGGCINHCYILQGEQRSFFVKTNKTELLSMFEAEYAGLLEIAESNTVKVPQPILYGLTDNHSFLVLENIKMVSCNTQSDTTLGHQLANLHKIKQAYFGWQQDNTIGSTPQINQQSDNWISFWQHHRFGFQLSLAENNGYSGKLISNGNKLSETLDIFFHNYQPHPSLLHGDLWSGNASVSDQGDAIIYDPACYYGDRETDIAMTELFGGFSSHFYAAYNESYPLDNDYPIRKNLYNLYHILNHLNLFGAGYLHQAEQLMDTLLTEIS